MSNLLLLSALEVHPLAHLNAALNALATVLLVVGFIQIKRGRELAHKRTMLAAFGVSVLFLISYLAYHVWPVGAAATKFRGEGGARVAYFVVLVSHIILAMLVPPLAAVTIFTGLRDYRQWHLRMAKITFPVWLYVSITGVVVYYMLYHMYPVTG